MHCTILLVFKNLFSYILGERTQKEFWKEAVITYRLAEEGRELGQ